MGWERSDQFLYFEGVASVALGEKASVSAAGGLGFDLRSMVCLFVVEMRRVEGESVDWAKMEAV